MGININFIFIYEVGINNDQNVVRIFGYQAMLCMYNFYQYIFVKCGLGILYTITYFSKINIT
jgi:hypothetical protein